MCFTHATRISRQPDILSLIFINESGRGKITREGDFALVYIHTSLALAFCRIEYVNLYGGGRLYDDDPYDPQQLKGVVNRGDL